MKGKIKNNRMEPVINDKPISRRDFVGWIIKGGILTTLSGMLAPALAYIWPVMKQGPMSDLQEVGNIDDFPEWSSKKIIIAGSAMMVIRTGKEFKAFSATCTHLGCLVDWDEKKREVVCPCHAGIFDLEGQVVSGPPPRPLPSYTVSVVNGKVFIKL